MAQATDIVLAGAGYMLHGASRVKYERAQDGAAEGRTGRVSLRDFFGGLRRPLQLERDRAYDGLLVGPALGGQGVIPWVRRSQNQLLTTPSAPAPSSAQRIPSCIVGDRVYFARGQYLYRTVTLQSGSWATEAMVYDAGVGNTILDLCPYAADGVLLTFGNGKDVTFWYPPTSTATALLAGEKGFYIAGYAGYAIWSDARTITKKSFLRMGRGDGVESRVLDYEITALVPAGAKLYAVTRSAIYSFTGRVKDVMVPNPAYDPESPGTTPPQIPGQEWSGDWTPYFQHGVYADPDDFAFFVGYGGRIYTWVAGTVMEDNPAGDRAGWRDTGLRGRKCFGGTVAGGYVVVSIESFEGNNELWAWDGSGWWCIGRKAASATGNWCWPTALAGAGGFDLLCFHEGLTSIDLFRLTYRSATSHNYPLAGEVPQLVSPLIDAGERDKAKAWRKVGAVFSSPERFGNLTSNDQVGVALDYSTDAGQTWTQVASASLTGNTLANMNTTLDADIASDAAVSRFLQLRVRWTSPLDWAPILTGIWTEFEVLDSPARRRRWRFTVTARDQVIDRDGSLLTRTGRQLIAELWAAWRTGTTLAFRDVDYDADPTERRVRIVGISELTPQPSDAGRWGDSAVTLTLVEV
jgi:hypothetical protein